MRERDGSEQPPLLPETRRLLTEVGEETGRRVDITADAAIRGRGRAIYVVTDPDPERHLILYDPKEKPHLDHLVGHECGHILRFARAEPEDRTVPVMTGERRAKAIRQLLPDIRKLVDRGVPEGAIADVYSIWLSGTIAQLSDTPADMFIEWWLWSKHPALRRAQEASLRSQVKALHLVNRPVVAAFTPESVWRASNAMNYALVKTVSRLVSDRSLVKPYVRGPVQKLGEELFEMVEESEDLGLAGDRRLSLEWAKRMGFQDWFEWRRLNELAPGFRHAWE
jgi:hypothetical protein